MVNRYDYGHLDIEKNDDILKLDAVFTRTGIFEYKKPDGRIIKELRSPEEVFKSDSIETLRLKPFTNEHPENNLNLKNAKYVTVGMTGENINIIDNELLGGKVSIFDEALVSSLNTGKREISCGYQCEVEYTPGIWQGQKYDAIQKNIRYNHASLVNKGRAGSNVCIRMDAEDAVMIDNNKEEKEKMVKIKLDSKEFEVQEDLKESIEKEVKSISDKLDSENVANKDKINSLTKEIETLKKKPEHKEDQDKVKAKIDSLTEKNTELQKKVDAIDETVTKRVKERQKLYDSAKLVCSEDVVSKLDTMSDVDIKKAVIATQTKTDMSDKSETYIEVRFDEAMETINNKIDSGEELGSIFLNVKKENKNDAAELKAKMIEEYKSNHSKK